MALLALLAGVGWLYRDALLLELIDIAMDLRSSIGPHREIEWVVRTRRGAPPRSGPPTWC